MTYLSQPTIPFLHAFLHYKKQWKRHKKCRCLPQLRQQLFHAHISGYHKEKGIAIWSQIMQRRLVPSCLMVGVEERFRCNELAWGSVAVWKDCVHIWQSHGCSVISCRGNSPTFFSSPNSVTNGEQDMADGKDPRALWQLQQRGQPSRLYNHEGRALNRGWTSLLDSSI